MKKTKIILHYTCLLIAVLWNTTSTNAQTYISAWWEYGNSPTANSIIRDDQSYRIIHTQHMDNNIGIYIHDFFIHEYASNTDVRYITQFDAVNSSDYSVNIMDMEIYNGYCYFCGSSDYDCLDMGGNIYSEGFVGKFSISSMFNSTSAIEYQTVTSTRSLHGIAISTPSNKAFPLVHMVGTMDYWHNYSACIAEIEQTGPATWKATLDYLPGIPKIHFSDIERVYGGVALVAQIKCSNDNPYGSPTYDTNHQQFLLDQFTFNGCHADHPSPGYDAMARYIMDYSDDYCFHLNTAPMKLCRTSCNLFLLAFGVRENDITKSGVRIFSFANSPFVFYNNIYYQIGKTQTILDMVSISNHNPIVLTQGEPYKNGIITMPNLTDPPQTYLKSFYDNEMRIHSLAIPPMSNFFEASGSEPVNTNLMRYDQNYSLWYMESCFKIGTIERIMMPFLEHYEFPVEWNYPYEDVEFRWNSAKIEYRKPTETNTCIKYKK